MTQWWGVLKPDQRNEAISYARENDIHTMNTLRRHLERRFKKVVLDVEANVVAEDNPRRAAIMEEAKRNRAADPPAPASGPHGASPAPAPVAAPVQATSGPRTPPPSQVTQVPAMVAAAAIHLKPVWKNLDPLMGMLDMHVYKGRSDDLDHDAHIAALADTLNQVIDVDKPAEELFRVWPMILAFMRVFQQVGELDPKLADPAKLALDDREARLDEYEAKLEEREVALIQREKALEARERLSVDPR
jgi:hypothetical protein